MKTSSEPPKKYSEFIERFPKLGEAWEAIHAAEAEGPLDKEGAVHAAARKALKAGASAEELAQVVVLATATLGMPGTVAAYGWVQDMVEREAKKD
jgi:hypothetical protein